MYNKINLTPAMLAGLARNAKGQISCIFLHWTAGYYNQSFKDYHLCIDGDGKVYSMCLNLTDKKAHTWHRNTGSVGIAMNCCWGAKCYRRSGEEIDNDKAKGIISPIKYGADWYSFPPTPQQIMSMAYAVACICFHADLPINANTVMTHAEIAKVDHYDIDSDDPEKKWDLLVLPGTPMSGGDYIRSLAKAYLAKLKRDREKLSQQLVNS